MKQGEIRENSICLHVPSTFKIQKISKPSNFFWKNQKNKILWRSWNFFSNETSTFKVHWSYMKNNGYHLLTATPTSSVMQGWEPEPNTTTGTASPPVFLGNQNRNHKELGPITGPGTGTRRNQIPELGSRTITERNRIPELGSRTGTARNRIPQWGPGTGTARNRILRLNPRTFITGTAKKNNNCSQP